MSTKMTNAMGRKGSSPVHYPKGTVGIRPQDAAPGDGGGFATRSSVGKAGPADPMALRPNAQAFPQAERTARMSESEATKQLHPQMLGDNARENHANATTPSHPGARERLGRGRTTSD